MPGEAITLARPPRDLRLDMIRGWMQVSIFVSHVAGTVFAWAIHASWGLSDSSEQFVFLSGLALGSVFTLKSARDGVAAAWADLARRTLRLYRTHLAVFLGFAAMVCAASVALPLPGEAARLGWCWLVDAPWFAVPAAAAMLYQPDFMGILPTFVWCMLLLPPFMLLAARWGAWALAPSGMAWLAVQLGWVATPALGRTGIAFDPLAWQLIFLIGALAGRRALLLGAALPRYRWLNWAALAVVLFGLAVRLVDYGAVPGPGALAQVLLHKEALAPARLLHALSLAWLVAGLMPREAAWMHGAPGRLLAAIGRHSLRVFCVGLFLAWGATTALRLFPAAAAWLDPLLIGTGVALLGVVAWLSDQRRPPPRPATPLQAGEQVGAQAGCSGLHPDMNAVHRRRIRTLNRETASATEPCHDTEEAPAPTESRPARFELAPVANRHVVAGSNRGATASNAGALLCGVTARDSGPVRRAAGCCRDARAPKRVEQEVATLVGPRVFGIALDHEDLVDHDRLQHCPVLDVRAGKPDA